MSLTPGIHDGIPMSEYLLMPALSGGRLNVLLTQSPFHALHNEGREASEVSDIGMAIHDAMLEGVDRIVTIDADDWRTKAAKEARDEARAAGKVPMLSRKVAQVHAAIAAAQKHVMKSEIAGAFDDGKAEQTVIWKEGDVLCKARPDWMGKGFHISLKTTEGNANPSAFCRSRLSQMGYDSSLVFYDRGLRANGLTLEHRILLVEQNPPYGCCIFGLAPSKWEYADSRVSRGIAAWQKCKQTGIYPAYPTQTVFAEAMPWELSVEEETQLNGAYDALQEKEGLQA